MQTPRHVAHVSPTRARIPGLHLGSSTRRDQIRHLRRAGHVKLVVVDRGRAVLGAVVLGLGGQGAVAAPVACIRRETTTSFA